ncbi:MAG: histidine kinase [Verrucomicrobia bacterium]|jgi:signal transduction histidine kinase|nr:histidine kinase [Verrucomicrobiota bacterium]
MKSLGQINLNAIRCWMVGVLICLMVADVKGQGSVVTNEVLRTALDIRRVTPERATNGLPVEVVGVVTLVDFGRTVFLQDETGGTFFKGPATSSGLQPGLRLRVRGKTFPGLYVPGIDADKVEVLEQGPLPTPRKVSFDDLAAGRFNYEWVELEGIGRQVLGVPQDRTTLLLAVGVRKIEVQVAEPMDAAHQKLVDARVRVRGLAAGFINDKRQLVAPHIRIQRMQEVEVLEPAPADAFERSLSPLNSLLRFAPDGFDGHRVKVQGVVTASETGNALFLRDEDRGLRVLAREVRRLEPGDVVEVSGFPTMGTFSAVLEDAVYRRVARTNAPEAVVTTVRQVLRGTLDANLISLEATVVEFLGGRTEIGLLLQSSNEVFRARLERSEGDTPLALEAGTRIRATGVCLVEQAVSATPNFSSSARSFELLLRSPGDIVVLTQPPWWTPARLAYAVGIVLLLALLALMWALQLSARVKTQTAIIRQGVEKAAALEERQRIAREFHDTLEQELVGLSLRLDAVVPRVEEPKARGLVEATRKLVGRLQVEAREFVWNLRGSEVDPALLRQLIERSAADMAGEVKVTMEVQGDLGRIPQSLAHPVLRIAQEAMANAVKHAEAKVVTVLIEVQEAQVRLLVKDDGKGFDLSKGSAVKPGHFGLQGMQERAKKAGGELRLASEPGKGTAVEFIAPLGVKG